MQVSNKLIKRYPLLIREILKYTDKTHSDYANLTSAKEKIEAVVKVANEATRVMGEWQNLETLIKKIESTTVILNIYFSRYRYQKQNFIEMVWLVKF